MTFWKRRSSAGPQQSAGLADSGCASAGLAGADRVGGVRGAGGAGCVGGAERGGDERDRRGAGGGEEESPYGEGEEGCAVHSQLLAPPFLPT